VSRIVREQHEAGWNIVALAPRDVHYHNIERWIRVPLGFMPSSARTAIELCAVVEIIAKRNKLLGSAMIQ